MNRFFQLFMVNLVTFIFIWTACKFFKEMEFGLRRRYCALCNVVVDVLTLMICSHSSLSFFSHSFYPRLTPFMLTFWFGIKKKWLSHLVLLVVRFQCWLIMILVMMCLCHFVVLLSVLDLGSILFLLFPPLFSLLFLLRPFPFSFRSFSSILLCLPVSLHVVSISSSRNLPLWIRPPPFSLPPLTTGFNRPLLSPPTSSQPSPTYPSIHTPDETTPGLAEGRTQMAVLKALRRSWARYTIGGRIPRRFSDGASESWKRRFLVSLFIFFLWFMGIFICLFLYSLRHIVVVGILLLLFFFIPKPF